MRILTILLLVGCGTSTVPADATPPNAELAAAEQRRAREDVRQEAELDRICAAPQTTRLVSFCLSRRYEKDRARDLARQRRERDQDRRLTKKREEERDRQRRIESQYEADHRDFQQKMSDIVTAPRVNK